MPPLRIAGAGLLAVVLLMASPSSAQGLDRDLYALLRLERWDELRQILRGRSLVRFEELYAAALVEAESAPNAEAALRAIVLLLKAAEVDCPVPSAAALTQCLERAPAGAAVSFNARLALWKAATIAQRRGLSGLVMPILGRAAIDIDDGLNRRMLALAMQWRLERNEAAEAIALAQARRVFSPELDLLLARSLLRQQQKGAALPLLLRTATDGAPDRVARAAAQEIRKNYAGIFEGASVAGYGIALRDLVSLGARLERDERNALRQKINGQQILQSTNATRVRGDGEFLILSGQAELLPALAERSYTFLAQKPEVIEAWANLLIREGQKAQAIALLRGNRAAMARRSGLWQKYIELIEEQSSDAALLNELLAFLKRHPSYFAVQDRLVRLLIGPDAEHIRWANPTLWNQSEAQLPSATARGRFVYWRHRYLKENNRPEEARAIERGFYAQMPGSFYAGAFWDRQDGGDFARDWRNVVSRESYMEWLSQHGGKADAWRFLSRQAPARFHNWEAMQFWKSMASGQFDPPAEIVLLYRLGETQLGSEYFEDRYRNRLTPEERIAALAALGRKSGHLNVAVYYTRLYLRETGLPEDPFTLPAPLLKTLYPRPYRRDVLAQARAYNVSEHAIYALMRQESMFVERAVSRSGARGLMQIMPATGRWLAQRMGLQGSDFTEPAVNIQMGAAFFADLMRSNAGDFRWAAIAYNGGPGNLRKWKRDLYRGDFYHFLESLPSEEARNYCRVTYQNYLHYATTYALYPED